MLVFHFSEESSHYFQERSVQVPFLTTVKPDSHQIFPFFGQKKYYNQSKELMTPFQNLHPVIGWEDEKNVLSICGPAWVRTHLKHFFPDLTTDESLMNFYEKENDPLLLNLVLINLLEICFFPQDERFQKIVLMLV